MIYSREKRHSTLDDFEHLLLKTKLSVLKEIDLKKINTGQKFETFVFEAMKECARNTIFEGSLYQTKDREFPDIVANQYWGVEVKFTKDDKWQSIGNSVLESSRIESVEKIYLFFGKCGGAIPEIKYRAYEECLSGISVTHYPRYQIDMELACGESIFSRMGVSYDSLRKSHSPIQAIKSYYRENMKKGNSLWWIDDKPSNARGLEITFFNNLEKEQKDKLITQGFILFPEIFNSHYERLCAFWVSYYSVICPNMRDQYSAGGRKKLSSIEAHQLGLDELSQLHYRFLCIYANKVARELAVLDLSMVSDCWNQEILTREALKEEWYKKIDSFSSLTIGANNQLSELFKKMVNS